MVSGAFCLASNLAGPKVPETGFGGTGWIIEPKAEPALGTTSAEAPFLTMDRDSRWAGVATSTYPR